MKDYLSIIQAKLKTEKAKDLSDTEIEKCFSGCVMPNKLTKLAKQLVLSGELTLEMVAQFSPEGHNIRQR